MSWSAVVIAKRTYNDHVEFLVTELASLAFEFMSDGRHLVRNAQRSCTLVVLVNHALTDVDSQDAFAVRYKLFLDQAWKL